MLDPWIGVNGMKFLKEETVKRYEDFLRPIDHMRLLPPDILAHGESNRWRETDLGSVLDINLIGAFLANRSQERLAVCEVGGGYGRLAEMIRGNYGTPVHYVMVDAVPGSLMYAYYHLKSQFPELSIGSFYTGDPYDTSYDCYILPAWRAELLPAAFFDVCVNIESMQEMEQHHVDFHLGLFDRLTVPMGEVYLSCSKSSLGIRIN
jgi:putative sugar O-methyltransferase